MSKKKKIKKERKRHEKAVRLTLKRLDQARQQKLADERATLAELRAALRAPGRVSHHDISYGSWLPEGVAWVPAEAMSPLDHRPDPIEL